MRESEIEFLNKQIDKWVVRINDSQITQTDIARLSGVSKGNISLILNKKRKNPGVRTLRLIEEAIQELEDENAEKDFLKNQVLS